MSALLTPQDQARAVRAHCLCRAHAVGRHVLHLQDFDLKVLQVRSLHCKPARSCQLHRTVSQQHLACSKVHVYVIQS